MRHSSNRSNREKEQVPISYEGIGNDDDDSDVIEQVISPATPAWKVQSVIDREKEATPVVTGPVFLPRGTSASPLDLASTPDCSSDESVVVAPVTGMAATAAEAPTDSADAPASTINATVTESSSILSSTDEDEDDSLAYKEGMTIWQKVVITAKRFAATVTKWYRRYYDFIQSILPAMYDENDTQKFIFIMMGIFAILSVCLIIAWIFS